MSKVHLVGLLSTMIAFVIFAVPLLVPANRPDAQQVLLAGLALGVCVWQLTASLPTRRRSKRERSGPLK
jgi:hypothetical protein